MKKNAMLVPLHEPMSFARWDHSDGTRISGLTFHLEYELYFLIFGKKHSIVAGQTIDLKHCQSYLSDLRHFIWFFHRRIA